MKFHKGDLVRTPHGNILPVQSDSNYDVHIGMCTYPAGNITLVKRMTDNHNTLQTEAAAHMDEQGRSADKYAESVERHFREILDDPAEIQIIVQDALTACGEDVLEYFRVLLMYHPEYESSTPDAPGALRDILRTLAHQEAEERAGRESDG